MNNELIDLQIRLSHQENHIQELDKVIYQQQQQLDGLRTKIELMEKHIRSLSGTNILAAAEEQPPPHY
jgi:SlyX protein